MKSSQMARPRSPKSQESSWEGVADWYDNHLQYSPDSYHEKVIAPNLLRILDVKSSDIILDLACGQGFFSRKIMALGATVHGADISASLIKAAKTHSPTIQFHTTPAHQLSFAKDGTYNKVIIILAIQNIGNLSEVLQEVNRVLKPDGRLIIVMNHPVFRTPKATSWGWDEQEEMQYRRVDSYLSSAHIKIDMHPGKSGSKPIETISYHRSLQDYVKALSKQGFAISRLEEWISHKVSEKGPRQKAEDTARKEIPLFMMVEARRS